MTDAAIVNAARLAKLRLELPQQEVDEWRVARAHRLSYPAISRGIAIELTRLGLTPEQIAATGTGPENIRKRLRGTR